MLNAHPDTEQWVIPTLLNIRHLCFSFDSTPESHKEAGVRLKAHTYELQESNVNLKLTLVDTVGYGDQINKEDSFRSILDYIDSQFEAFLQAELALKNPPKKTHKKTQKNQPKKTH
jgi:septin family protein